jgi:hypothetical protein
MAAGTKTLLAVAGMLAVLATASAHDRITTRVTWDRDVAPILQSRCVRCHQRGGRAPMPLGTYAEARPWARAIKEQVLLRRMPKWHAVRGFGDLANDPSLSPFEIALIASWVDGGAPERAANATTAAAPSVRVSSPSVEPAARGAKRVTVGCDDGPLPAGRLVALQPHLEKGASAGFAARFPDGTREILVWVKGYDPEFPEEYWLRTPLPVPRGSRLEAETTGRCTVTLRTTDR